VGSSEKVGQEAEIDERSRVKIGRERRKLKGGEDKTLEGVHFMGGGGGAPAGVPAVARLIQSEKTRVGMRGGHKF